jgi:hypothetical protein
MMARRMMTGTTMDREKQRQQPAQSRDQDAEDERDRRATNIFLAVAAVLVIGVGIWLINAMADARKAQLCLESGRRNCTPIEVPPRRLD